MEIGQEISHEHPNEDQRHPGLLRVGTCVFVAHKYSISNIIFIVTNQSVVAIDSGESLHAARRALRDFRAVSDLRISHLIYTHFHGDHIRGARAICEPATQIIAQCDLPAELAAVKLLLPYRARVDAVQFGLMLDRKRRGVSHGKSGRNGYVPPQVLFQTEYKFETGDVSFELYHAPGESHDHTIIWLPQERIVFSGDLFYDSFPMLGNPLKPDRPVLSWATSIDRIRSLHPEYLVPSHGLPLSGAEKIAGVLENYSAAIRSVHDQTVDLINSGLSLERICRAVALPAHLRDIPYLQPKYGNIDWAVRGIYRQYTGWYDFNPTNLYPVPSDKLSRALINASNGVQPIMRQARSALKRQDYQLALALTDIILKARPRHRGAHRIRLQTLRQLGNLTDSRVARNLYRSAERSLRTDFQNRKPAKSAIPSPVGNASGPFHDPVFILAAPRSCTSVICAMLGQHPQMYGMPELHLFKSETMLEWFELCRQESFPRAHGMLRAVAQLFFGSQTEETIRAARAWLRARAHFTSGQLLKTLAQKVFPATMIEKSPSISYEQESFFRIRRMFPRARFIHLVRHPKAQGESVIKYMKVREQYGPIPPNHWLRFLAWSDGPNNGNDPDPQMSWYRLNQSLLQFLDGVPQDQQKIIRAEDVLTDPAGALRPVLGWLSLRQDADALERMKHPEQSPYACMGPKGAEFGNDRLFLEKPELRPTGVSPQILEGTVTWRTDGTGLCAEVIDMARSFGYQ